MNRYISRLPIRSVRRLKDLKAAKKLKKIFRIDGERHEGPAPIYELGRDQTFDDTDRR